MADWVKETGDWTFEVGGKEEKTDEPYVHWYFREDLSRDPDSDFATSGFAFASVLKLINREFSQYAEMQEPQILSEVPDALNSDLPSDQLYSYPDGAVVENPDVDDRYEVQNLQPISADGLRKDTVIVGIVDTGISLSHRHFRFRDGSTRFLYAWQQGARRPANGSDAGRGDVPWGREYYAEAINEALDAYAPHGKDGWIDEDGFNREMGLVEPLALRGSRELDKHASHGTHVLSLATGMDPTIASDEDMHRQRIVAVNLPSQYAHGTAGNFLAKWAVWALARIIVAADKAWDAWRASASDDPLNTDDHKGYPIVINFSYGMQSGPKDGSMRFEIALKELIRKRKLAGYTSPIRIVMPAGNEAQYQGSANIILGDPKQRHHRKKNYKVSPNVSLTFRLQPDDYTDNYLEFFSEGNVAPDGSEHSGEETKQNLLAKLKLRITPPGSRPISINGLELNTFHNLVSNGHHWARLYCMRQGERRTRFVLCTQPTASHNPSQIVAPAGAWKVELCYEDVPSYFHFYVQSDQSAVQGSSGSKRAYLDHEQYESHVLLERGLAPIKRTGVEDIATYGGWRHSYHYDPIQTIAKKSGKGNGEWWPHYGPVQRRGTHNAIASAYIQPPLGAEWRDYASPIMCIGGYEALHGRPAIYSGVSDGVVGSTHEAGREVISASFPSEDAPNHFGVLSAGARDGSVVAYRGTSMATALATRALVDGFLNDAQSEWIGSPNWFKQYRRHEDHWGQRIRWRKLNSLMTGAGRRVRSPASLSKVRRVARLGEGGR